MMTTEQIVASHKANVETLFGSTSKAFEGMEKLVELNLTATKAALSESAHSTKAALSVKDAQELIALQANLFQPLAEKTAAAQKQFANLVDSTTSNAPAGSETAVAMMKSAVNAANNAYESVQKAVKQATDMAEANMAAVTNTAVATAKTAAKKR